MFVLPSLARGSITARALPDRAIDEGLSDSTTCCGTGLACDMSAVQSVPSARTAYATRPRAAALTTFARNVAVATAPGVAEARLQRDSALPLPVRRKPLPPSKTTSLWLSHERACVSAPFVDCRNSVMPPLLRGTSSLSPSETIQAT